MGNVLAKALQSVPHGPHDHSGPDALLIDSAFNEARTPPWPHADLPCARINASAREWDVLPKLRLAAGNCRASFAHRFLYGTSRATLSLNLNSATTCRQRPLVSNQIRYRAEAVRMAHIRGNAGHHTCPNETTAGRRSGRETRFALRAFPRGYGIVRQ